MKLTADHMARLKQTLATAAAATFAMALSAAVFCPLLTSYFRIDDFLHLFHQANYSLLTNLLIPNGGHVYVVRNFVFFLCWHLFGMQPFGYYALALLTHVVNVGLLFAVIHRLTGSNALAAFGAVLWGTCPLQADVLGWYSVYGHALAATALLVLLYQIIGLARDGSTPSRARLLAWSAIALAGTTCFGVGLAVAMALPFVILVFFPGHYPWWRPPLLALLVIVPSLYLVLLRAYEVVWPTDLHIFATGLQLVSFSGFGVPLAMWELATYGASRELCGLWCIGDAAHALTVPVASTIAVVLLVTMAAVGLRDRRARPALLACGVLAAAIYAILSTARGFLFLDDSDVRHMATYYHYAALIPVTIALCVTLQSVTRHWPLPRPLPTALVLLWGIGVVTALMTTPPWLHLGTGEREQTAQFVDSMHAAAAETDTGAVYVRNRTFRPLLTPGPFFPGIAAVFTLYFDGDSVDGKRFYFVEPNEEMRGWSGRGVPINRLLIAPESVPPGTVLR